MSGPLIFISHNQETAPAAEFRKALVEALADAGFETWFDQHQMTGSEVWRADIDRALQMCRAGVVLLSPPAVASGFVPYEVNVLAHRRSRSSRFMLLPVYLDGLRREDLAASTSWSAVDLPSLQAVPASVTAIVEKLRPLLELHRLDSPLARLENVLAESLEQAGRGALASVAERLKMPAVALEDDLPRVVGQRLLEVSVEDQYDALRLIADVSVALATKVYVKVAPHGWIPSAAAEAVRATATRPRGERGAGINAADPLTCNMYVSRAFHGWHACEVEGGVSDDDVAELLERSRGALLEWLRHAPEDPVPSDAEIDIDIADAADDLPFLVLPLDAAFPAALAAVREAWPHVPILLRCAEDTDVTFDVRQLPFMTILRPPVVPDEEARIVPMYKKHLRAFHRQAGAAA